MSKITRRRFIRDTALIGAAATAFPLPSSAGQKAQRRWVVHPNVDNLRVVGVSDSAMTKQLAPVSSWKQQNGLTVSKAVWENIDRLAAKLAQTKDPTEAWRSIFVKPPKKSWSDTVVAIKTNNIALQHTRNAVMTKITTTLVKILGVRATNIHIYDACHGDTMNKKTPFYDLPSGCRVDGKWGGSTTLVSIPKPWREGRAQAKCLEFLADNTVDILINIALCKGHDPVFGGFTMTMKNHLGTFEPQYAHQDDAHDYLVAINKTPEVLGQMDPKTGRVLFPRQQLCLVDALWASRGGPQGLTTHQPNFIAMGVLAPVVDYQIATKFRGNTMNWPLNQQATRRMLTEFGYGPSDLPQGGRLILL